MNIQSVLAINVLKSVGSIALAIGILLAMVTVHEFGHYIVGKLLNFKITEFSVGFGPAIFKRRSKKSGELFALRVVPLGGYCAFDGEDEYEEDNQETEAEETAQGEPQDEYPEPKGERFNDQAPWKRILVLIAGATMNYLLALLLIVIMFAGIGRPVYKVVKYEPTAESSQTAITTYHEGLKTGDLLLKINGKTIYQLTDCLDELNGKKQGEAVTLLISRDGKEQEITINLYENATVQNLSDNASLFYSLGIACREEVINDKGETEIKTTRGGAIYAEAYETGFFPSIGHSFIYSFKIGSTVLRSLGELITGKLAISAMGGPITTISLTAQAATSGLMSFLNIAAFIGVNLAVFNLLPVPALDGCKVIFCLIEWIRKKPVNRKIETIINLVGIIFLFGFAILVDLLQLFI